MNSPERSLFADIVGARAFMAGKTPHITGVVARGDSLIVRLVAPAGDLTSRLALPALCAVPIGTPLDPKGGAHDPFCRALRRRLVHAGAGGGTRAKPQLQGKQAAPPRPDRTDLEHPHVDRLRDRKRRGRLRPGWSRPGRRAAHRQALRARGALPHGRAGSGTSCTRRSVPTTSSSTRTVPASVTCGCGRRSTTRSIAGHWVESALAEAAPKHRPISTSHPACRASGTPTSTGSRRTVREHGALRARSGERRSSTRATTLPARSSRRSSGRIWRRSASTYR